MEQVENQEGVVEEQPKEEISKEVPKASSEEKATSKDDEWKRMMQSRTDKAESKSQKLEEQLQKLQDRDRQRVSEERAREIEKYADEPEEQAKVRRKHQLEDEVSQLEEQRTKNEGAVERKYDQALELASKYNLGLSDARDLMKAETPREMELLAQLKVKDLEKPQVESKTEIPTPDSGKSDAGTDSDEAFMKDYSEGKSNDHARAQKILAKVSNEKLV